MTSAHSRRRPRHRQTRSALAASGSLAGWPAWLNGGSPAIAGSGGRYQPYFLPAPTQAAPARAERPGRPGAS